MRRWLPSSVGAALCIVAAGTVSLLLYSSALKSFVPLFFLVPILALVLRFGSIVGLIGTLATALIFATFLFEPRFNWAVADVAARSHLIWMVLIGIIACELLGKPGQRGMGPSRR